MELDSPSRCHDGGAGQVSESVGGDEDSNEGFANGQQFGAYSGNELL